MAIESINPTTGETIRSFNEMPPSDAAGVLQQAHEAFLEWRKSLLADRAEKIRTVGHLLRQHEEEFARLMAMEMGKPVKQGRAEVEKCAKACDYFAEEGPGFLGPQTTKTEAKKSFVVFEPLGVVLAVMPWNFPLWQVIRAAVPAVMAGNAVVLKHASNVPGCALVLEESFRTAGCPTGLMRALLVGSKQVDALIENPAVRAVTLTGSSEAGRAVAAKAGQCLKKTVLELGGSDPYVILEDADLARAADICAKARLINSGQSCIAAKRFVVVESVREDFEKRLVEQMEKQKVGDPMTEDVTVGPLARMDLRDTLHEQVERSVKMGAKVLLGGKKPTERRGAFYPPTVLTSVKKGMPVYDEETFGPVAAVISVADEAEAIRRANDTAYGLGGAIFTKNLEKGERLASHELAAGFCAVNDFVRSDPRLPFGGIKDSGYGRELSCFGIREFVNVKTVYIGDGK